MGNGIQMRILMTEVLPSGLGSIREAERLYRHLILHRDKSGRNFAHCFLPLHLLVRMRQTTPANACNFFGKCRTDGETSYSARHRSSTQLIFWLARNHVYATQATVTLGYIDRTTFTSKTQFFYYATSYPE